MKRKKLEKLDLKTLRKLDTIKGGENLVSADGPTYRDVATKTECGCYRLDRFHADDFT